MLELEGAPFWKRFSFTRNEWLPLPAVTDLASVSFAGNLNALFVLDRISGEVRKYALSDLSPAGAVKLPGAGFANILAGCNTDGAPVHVLGNGVMFSLSSHDLSRIDLSASGVVSKANQGRFTAQDIVRVTGDGLSFVGHRDANHYTFFYKNDVDGLGPKYFDIGHVGWPSGVSAAYRIGSGLMCFANPGGAPLETKMPARLRPYFWQTLAANGPTILRVTLGEREDIPPTVPRIECISFFDSSPFAGADAPELAGIEPPNLEG